jgi:hypothetical protein
MATGTYYVTEIKNAGRTDNNSPVGTINTGASGDTLSVGETITYSGNPYIYQGTVTVAAAAGGTTSGFYAVREGKTFLFTIQDPANNVTYNPTPGGETFVCFMPGTLIATPQGERAIEDLAIGDEILTASGRAAPIRWIGRQTVAARFANADRALPIRIRAGALGDSLPLRDLLVSPGHAMLVDGILAQAGALVNGTSIRREDDVPEVFTYYNIELAEHDLILADGVAAETFVDNVSRSTFDNGAEHTALYGDVTIPEMDLPRATAHRQIPAATRQRLAAIAAGMTDGTAAAA